MSKVFRASRWSRSFRGPKSQTAEPPSSGVSEPTTCGIDDGEGDYLNCPMTADEYAQFHAAVVAAEKAALHDFDEAKFFEGCLPIEVMAGRGVDTLRFG